MTLTVSLPLVLILSLAGQGTYPSGDASTRVAVRVPDVARTVAQRPVELPPRTLERLNAGIPWPRGLAVVDDEIVVLARGRHRNYGGPAQDYEDHAGRLYLVDPDVAEPYTKGAVPSARVIENQRVLADPDPAVVHLFDRTRAPVESTLMNRPYCTLVYDAASRNVVFCAYAGVDLSEKPNFKKNATDALYRFDLRSKTWGVVEMHRDDVVPPEARSAVISNEYYPHHDPARNAAPHGLLNGPNGCAVVGNWLYAVGKDNHTLARYDLTEIRRDPQAGPPRAEKVLGDEARVKVLGVERTLALQGHSAVDAHGGWLYLGTRTNSLVVRFPIDAEGALIEPIVGELVAEFEPYDEAGGKSADLWDLKLNSKGELFVSCARKGRVWKVIVDPLRPFDGNDERKESPTTNQPYLDMVALTGAKNARISNLTFDAQDRMLFCATFTEAHTERAGGVFRVIEGH